MKGCKNNLYFPDNYAKIFRKIAGIYPNKNQKYAALSLFIRSSSLKTIKNRVPEETR
jgi:hypothetical protein